MVFFTGRNKMKFFLPMKPCKQGFKIHFQLDSKTHYLYDVLYNLDNDYQNLIIEDENQLTVYSFKTSK